MHSAVRGFPRLTSAWRCCPSTSSMHAAWRHRHVQAQAIAPSSGGRRESNRRRGRGRGRHGDPEAVLPSGSTSVEAVRLCDLGDRDSLRLFELVVPFEDDPGKDNTSLHPALLKAVADRLRVRPSLLTASCLAVVRKSFDATRGQRRVRRQGGTRGDRASTSVAASSAAKAFVYVVDVARGAVADARASRKKLPLRLNWMERLPAEAPASPAHAAPHQAPFQGDPVIVVGSGPAGLFAALTAATAGARVVLLERGQGVEARGRDIGALFVRGRLNPESNLCYGEGGAGTWSDGKLTTRIGRNSGPVRRVLQSLVDFGAPASILVAGKPHLGTDRLVRILKAMRAHLQSLGVDVRFGAKVADIRVLGDSCAGVVLDSGESMRASAVVLAVGHSARPLYKVLSSRGVAMTAKPFAMGFRIEHPQALIDEIQYGAEDAAGVMRGKGRLPVADYSLAAQVLDGSVPFGAAESVSGIALVGSDPQLRASAQGSGESSSSSSSGSIGRGGDTVGAASSGRRGVYSFCMCPGGQIVPTSTSEDELCINGMSFSRRNSQWANSALVVTIQPHDWAHLLERHGPLAGMELQRSIERAGAAAGGGGFRAPVQLAPDFLAGTTTASIPLPTSSYRLGVTRAPLHELYGASLTGSIQRALAQFDDRMPGFAGEQALLHGVETRTSAPVRIERDDNTLQSVSLKHLYPCGEGAGYAGGIMSAAVDGLRVGEAVVRELLGVEGAGGVAGVNDRLAASLSKY